VRHMVVVRASNTSNLSECREALPSDGGDRVRGCLHCMQSTLTF